MNYELALRLKEAGFPQHAQYFWIKYCDNPEKQPGKIEYFLWQSNRSGGLGLTMNGRTHLDNYAAPTLEDLLRELGEDFKFMRFDQRKGYEHWQPKDEWVAMMTDEAHERTGYKTYMGEVKGSTPEESLANLWLALHAENR
jgi:hypothetical protein